MDLDAALNELLGDRRTGDTRQDLIRAAMVAIERRRTNSEAGGAVLASLRDDEGMTYREIEVVTGIPRSTAQRWADPPPVGQSIPDE